jgi:predicted SprT family Zn-dependent metalloprotease
MMAQKRAKKTVSYAAAGLTADEYQKIQQAFNFFNCELYKDQPVPQPLITFSRRGGSFGYFSAKRFQGKRNSATAGELSLNPDHFARPDIEIAGTLVHEMCHAWQYAWGHPSRAGYHNVEWGSRMKQIGLYPSSTGRPGGRETGGSVSHYIIPDGPFDRAFKKLAATGWRLDWQSRAPERKQRNSKTKHTCPQCGRNVWGVPEPEYVDCHKCGVLMIPQDKAVELANVSYAAD